MFLNLNYAFQLVDDIELVYKNDLANKRRFEGIGNWFLSRNGKTSLSLRIPDNVFLSQNENSELKKIEFVDCNFLLLRDQI